MGKSAPADQPPANVTPLARHLALQGGLDISRLAADDRVTMTAVMKALGRELNPLSGIAPIQEGGNAPHLSLSVDVSIDALETLREKFNKRSAPGQEITLIDFLVRACAFALKKAPVKRGQVDIAIAMALAGRLVTPVIKKADGKGIAQISEELRALADRARDGRLAPEECGGAAITISNLGLYGIKNYSALPQMPESIVLSMGASERRIVLRDEKEERATVLNLTLTCDHRALDAVGAAEVLMTLQNFAENPVSMLL